MVLSYIFVYSPLICGRDIQVIFMFLDNNMSKCPAVYGLLLGYEA